MQSVASGKFRSCGSLHLTGAFVARRVVILLNPIVSRQLALNFATQVLPSPEVSPTPISANFRRDAKQTVVETEEEEERRAAREWQDDGRKGRVLVRRSKKCTAVCFKACDFANHKSPTVYDIYNIYVCI